MELVALELLAGGGRREVPGAEDAGPVGMPMGRAFPHEEQKVEPIGFGWPQCGHGCVVI